MSHVPQNEVLKKMPPLHVPPLCAPTQNKTVPVQSAELDDGYCAYWSKCKLGRMVCNGYTKEQCGVYGTNGTHAEEAPSNDELKYLIRIETWKDKGANCAWSPFCGKAIECG